VPEPLFRPATAVRAHEMSCWTDCCRRSSRPSATNQGAVRWQISRGRLGSRIGLRHPETFSARAP
jgi:hypothetical protein